MIVIYHSTFIKMKKLFFSLCMMLAAGLHAQTADEIIDKHIEATGGKEAYAQIKTCKMSGKMVVGPGQEAPMEITSVNNTAFKMELVIQGMTMIQAINGNTGWMIMPFQGNPDPQPLTPDDIKAASSQLDLTGDLYNYKEKGSQVEFIGTDDMEGTEVYKIKVTKKDGNIIYHYIDTETYYDLKTTQKVVVQDKEMESSSLMSNYKKTNSGLVMPFSMSGTMGEVTWTSIEINVPVDNKIFEQPSPKKPSNAQSEPTNTEAEPVKEKKKNK